MIVIRILVYTGKKKEVARTLEHSYVTKWVKANGLSLIELVPFRKIVDKCLGIKRDKTGKVF